MPHTHHHIILVPIVSSDIVGVMYTGVDDRLRLPSVISDCATISSFTITLTSIGAHTCFRPTKSTNQ